MFGGQPSKASMKPTGATGKRLKKKKKKKKKWRVSDAM